MLQRVLHDEALHPQARGACGGERHRGDRRELPTVGEVMGHRDRVEPEILETAEFGDPGGTVIVEARHGRDELESPVRHHTPVLSVEML